MDTKPITEEDKKFTRLVDRESTEIISEKGKKEEGEMGSHGRVEGIWVES